MRAIFFVLTLLAVGACGHPVNSGPAVFHYRFPVYPMIQELLFFRSDPVADVEDAFPAVFWVQAPANGAFAAGLPPLVISPVQQSHHPDKETRLSVN